MAGTMNFFRAQDEARGRTTKLVVLLVLAIMVLAGSFYVLAVLGKGYATHSEIDWLQGDLFCLTSGLALVVILGGSLVRIAELSKGGGAIAVRLGGRLVSGVTKDLAERRYLNVVQEMALAAGLPVPLCFVLDHDESINAFAAGNSPQDAAVGITRGALLHLTRDELQGVIAHEFSHIGNGDMKLNLRIIGAIAGLTALAQLGYIFFRLAGSVRGKNSAPIALGMVLAGVVVLLIGSGGILFAKVIQAAVSREREYLADASAVQFTRNPFGLGSALKKIAGFSGSRGAASEAELEAQHLFFASSGGFLESLFSTHPPINERIRRIDPAFDGIIPAELPGNARFYTHASGVVEVGAEGGDLSGEGLGVLLVEGEEFLGGGEVVIEDDGAKFGGGEFFRGRGKFGPGRVEAGVEGGDLGLEGAGLLVGDGEVGLEASGAVLGR